MKLKLDEQGHVVVQDGKPVYVHDDGKEIPFDAAAATSKIASLNGEAKSHRERAEAAEAKVKAFDGLDDPAEARKALETLKNLDQKKLIDAGEVEKVKAEVIKTYEEKLKAETDRAAGLEGQLYDEKIGGSFARSKFITEKLLIPADIAQASFGKAFKIEDGRVVAYDHTGSKIFSRARPGELADFDEAVETLVNNYPNRDAILRGSGASGGGTNPNGGGGGAKKTLTRAQFDALGPAEKAAIAAEQGKGTAVITD